MSLSPFDSFQSRFVTYFLNRPRILNVNRHKCYSANAPICLSFSAPSSGGFDIVFGKVIKY